MKNETTVNSMWNRAQAGEGAIPQELQVSPETKQKIQEAFCTQPNEDSIKAFRTPVDIESMAKAVY